MASSSSGDKGNSVSIPMLGPEDDKLNFRTWHTAMSALIASLTTDTNLLVDQAPPPGLDLLAIAQIANANQRRIAEAEKTISDVWKNGQKRASTLLLTAVSRNENASNLLSRQRSEAVVVPALRDGEHLPIADMLGMLNTHYIPINELRAISTEKDLKNTILKRNEPLTKFLVRFEHGLELARAQGKNFTLVEQKALLDTCLKSGEKVMEGVINTLQMQMGPMSWLDVTTYLKRYDDTEMGSARLLPSKPRGNNIDTVAFVQGEKKKNNIYKKNLICSNCKKSGHNEKNCWVAHSEKMPAKFRRNKRTADSESSSSMGNNKKKRKTWPHTLTDDKDDEEVSALFDTVMQRVSTNC